MAACDGCSSRIPAASADNGARLTGLASPVPSIRERRPRRITPHIPASARGVQCRYDQGRQKAQEWQQDLEQYVQDQPVKALLIAAGVGMLLGILWKRS